MLSDCICDVMVSVLASIAVDGGFELWSGQTKDYKIGICCFSAKHETLRSKSKTGCLVIWIMCLSGATCLPVFCCFSVRVEQLVYQCSVVSVSEWSNLSTSVLLFQCLSGATCLPVFCCFSELAL